jgi:hypothetical protein
MGQHACVNGALGDLREAGTAGGGGGIGGAGEGDGAGRSPMQHDERSTRAASVRIQRPKATGTIILLTTAMVNILKPFAVPQQEEIIHRAVNTCNGKSQAVDSGLGIYG